MVSRSSLQQALAEDAATIERLTELSWLNVIFRSPRGGVIIVRWSVWATASLDALPRC